MPQDSGGLRTVTVTDPSNATTTYTFNIASARMTSMTDALGHTSNWQYDGAGRPTLVTAPEGNSTELAYDARGNVTTTTVHAKPGSGQADLVTTAGYDPSCSNVRTCNSPNWTRDAKGAQTDYAYDPTHGGVTSVTAPADVNGVRPQVRTGYTGFTDQFGGTLYRATSTSACRTTSACAGGADETVSTITYGGLADVNLLPVTVTRRAGDSSVSTTASVTYDTTGNVTSATDPLGAVSTFQYDAARRQVLAVSPDPDGGGPRRSAAVRTSWNGDNTVARVEAGSSAADGSGFGAAQQVDSSYDTAGRKLRETLSSGGTAYSVTQYGYDTANRRTCAVVRMDPGQWNGQGDACAPQTGGPSGPDRLTMTQYDALGRTQDVTSGYGTGDAATEHDAYTVNGRNASVTDANGNVTSYSYDGFDRLATTTYPGGSYEALGYDANGNVTSRRLRDGQVLAYSYDALNRRIYDDNPSTNVAEVDVSYAYDLLGHLTQANDQNGWLKAYEFDALGRATRERSNVYDNYFQYDAAGRRVRQTWADGFFVTYDYDAAGSMTTIRENGGFALASFGYDDLGRRTSLARGNGTVTNYAYDPASRLSQLSLGGGNQPNTVTLGYNPGGQIASRASSNDAYAWTGAVNVNRSYGVNGLNQYTSAGGTAFGYDGRGNLTSSGSAIYGYNSRNQLFQAPGVQLIYRGPSGELGQVSDSSGAITNFDWAGGQLATETSAGIARRYVYGPGTDEPLVWYEGAGTSDRRYLHADERGSIVEVTNDAGNAIAVNTYDEYGIPGAGNIGRFQYTGQVWLPQVGLYDYKARMYSPTLGRFLQTDPIGYGDGLNWYNYVGGDPVNGSDPSGMMTTTCTGSIIRSNTGCGGGASPLTTIGGDWHCTNCNERDVHDTAGNIVVNAPNWVFTPSSSFSPVAPSPRVPGLMKPQKDDNHGCPAGTTYKAMTPNGPNCQSPPPPVPSAPKRTPEQQNRREYLCGIGGDLLGGVVGGAGGLAIAGLTVETGPGALLFGGTAGFLLQHQVSDSFSKGCSR